MDANDRFIETIQPDGISYGIEEKGQLDIYHKSFAGIGRLIGKRSYMSLLDKHVMIIGLGGVGSWSAESIVRSGIGRVTLVDIDDICITNINRQLPALHSKIGQQKIDVLKDRLLAINPLLEITCVHDYYTKDTSDEILSTKPDLVIDAIDSLSNKSHLAAQCLLLETPLIVCGAAGGRLDPTLIRTSDLKDTRRDRLLKAMRKKLKYTYGVETGAGKIGIYAVYSEEAPMFPNAEGELSPKPVLNGYGLDCNGGLGSASFVTGCFGMAAASVAVRHFMNISNK